MDELEEVDLQWSIHVKVSVVAPKDGVGGVEASNHTWDALFWNQVLVSILHCSLCIREQTWTNEVEESEHGHYEEVDNSELFHEQVEAWIRCKEEQEVVAFVIRLKVSQYVFDLLEWNGEQVVE